MTAQLTAQQRGEIRSMRLPYHCGVCGQLITTDDPMIAEVRNRNGQAGWVVTKLMTVHKDICPSIEEYGVYLLGRLSELQHGR